MKGLIVGEEVNRWHPRQIYMRGFYIPVSWGRVPKNANNRYTGRLGNTVREKESKKVSKRENDTDRSVCLFFKVDVFCA